MALGFGTSGLRGLVTELTDRACALYVRAFIRYLKERQVASRAMSLAGDFRTSTPRLLRAVTWATRQEGLEPDWCGFIPTPALALHAISRSQPSLMVTGSHIPDDRNGIKFNLPWGEILKSDEAGITRQHAELLAAMERDEELAAPFNAEGMLCEEAPAAEPLHTAAQTSYVRRYLDFFPRRCLAGRKIAVYQHSSVARDILVELLEGLGATTVRLGRSDRFIPVDTEAVENPEQLAAWVRGEGVHALVSADGDGDRPLVVDERGTVIRGDVLGVLVAAYLRADSVSAPVSCNTVLERCGSFRRIERTRIGSPFVIESMMAAVKAGCHRVVGFEANGGFLLGSEVGGETPGTVLAPLPTRDAALPILACLHAASRRALNLSQLVASLPRRFTCSGLLRPFPSAQGKALAARFADGGTGEADRWFSTDFGPVQSLDLTDGARISFQNGDVVHLRPSGNAPEFRVYTESSSPEAAAANNARAMTILRSHAS